MRNGIMLVWDLWFTTATLFLRLHPQVGWLLTINPSLPYYMYPHIHAHCTTLCTHTNTSHANNEYRNEHGVTPDEERSTKFPVATSPEAMLASFDPLLSKLSRSDWSREDCSALGADSGVLGGVRLRRTPTGTLESEFALSRFVASGMIPLCRRLSASLRFPSKCLW